MKNLLEEEIELIENDNLLFPDEKIRMIQELEDEFSECYDDEE